MIKKLAYFISMVVAATCSVTTFACTSAIVSASANPSGRPVLWKHRDTSTIDNKVEYVPAKGSDMAYVALFNAADARLREAWMGMNEAGFAVMNTASYNIKADKVPEKDMDKEGFLMTKALRTCRTVEDFARLLDSYPRPMGVEANFGVIDALGNGAYFETNNDSYIRFNLEDEPDGVLVRTNYSHSGRKGEGYGFIREADAECMLKPFVENRNVTPELLTEKLSRTFYHDGMKQDLTMSEKVRVPDEDFIPRYKSTATIAIEGCVPVASLDSVAPDFVADQYIMWTGMGYPPVSVIEPVRCAPDGVPADLRGSLPGGRCEAGVKARNIRDEVFTPGKKKGQHFINMRKLFNAEGTGYAQKAMKHNKEVYRKVSAERDE